ncbi:MAG TPA: hypothetical protein VLT62_28520 [Candidatus Methylomirabilis sp.]|nr:hypothetical protein [Candidatus Methylomirabilis sp.]
MISLQEINALPIPERDRCYFSLVPPALCQRFALDPISLTDAAGRSVARVEASPRRPSVQIRLTHRADALDPAFFLRLEQTRYGNLQIRFIVLNDPDSPRFGVDLDDEGNVTDLGVRSRNLREEERAVRAGLAPGQVRPGIRMLRPALDRIEGFAARLGMAALVLEAFFYHNAILYERHGFGYLAGQDRMEMLHRGFLPGGPLQAKLDGSGPFRMQGAGETIRGRSWAVHDGILPQRWWPPQLFRPVGIRLTVCTAPGVPF